MTEKDALTLGCKDNFVLPCDIAASQRGKPDFTRFAFAGVTVPDCLFHILKINAPPAGEAFTGDEEPRDTSEDEELLAKAREAKDVASSSLGTTCPRRCSGVSGRSAS
mgnify:CR=1 FL=1